MLSVNKHDSIPSGKQFELVCFSTKITFGISAGLEASFDQNVNEEVMSFFQAYPYLTSEMHFPIRFLLWDLKYNGEQGLKVHDLLFFSSYFSWLELS